MKLLKRWLAFFVVVVLLIGVAFNSRGPLIASQVDGTTEGAADPSAASTEDGQQIPEGGDLQSQVIQGTEPTEPTVPEGTEGLEPVQDPSASGTGSEEPKAEEPKADEEPKDETQEEVVHQDAVELKQDLTDENNNVICSVTANIPEGTFEANTSDVTMEVGYAAADTAEQIKALIEKNIAAENQLGEYFLYNVVFKVKGEQVEPGKEIKITFEPKDFKVKDTKKAVTFYYNEANSPVGNAAAEIVGITQKADKIEELQNAGQSIDTVDDDYDLSEISLREDGTAEKVMMEGRRSTIYGCYVEEKKPEEPKKEEEKKDEVKTDDTKTTEQVLEYEDDDVKVHVSADKEGIIPEGATLQVVPIKKDDDQYKEIEEQLKKKAEEEAYDIAGFLAYDISFVDKEGKEIEPNGEVKVSMEYKNAALPEDLDEETAKNADVTVMHLEEDETGQIKDVVDLSKPDNGKSSDGAESKVKEIQTTDSQKVEKAEFVTESFSAMVLTWTNGRNISNIFIKDDIISNGVLIPKVEGITSGAVTFNWYKSIDEQQNWTQVKRIKVTGEEYNIAVDGSWLNPSLDGGARTSENTTYYKVRPVINGIESESIESEAYLVDYWAELQNGSFETPKVNKYDGNIQFSNEEYKSGKGVWQSTGIGPNNKAIEIINTGIDPDTVVNPDKVKDSYKWYGDLKTTDGGAQFAELNCSAAGALYQDVITIPGTTLNYWLSHRARGVNRDAVPEYDTMYVLIMSTQLALTAGKDGGEVDTQEEVNSIIYALKTDPNKYPGAKVVEYRDDDQSWHTYNDGTYGVPSEQYLTRFFFVAGDTASRNPTVGNFLDNVGFSMNLPPAADDEGLVKLIKTFDSKGMTDTEIELVKSSLEFTITGTKYSETVKGTDLEWNNNGTIYTGSKIVNLKIPANSSDNYTITENSVTSGFEDKGISLDGTTVKVGDEPESPETSTSVTLSQGDSKQVTFTNIYTCPDKPYIKVQKTFEGLDNPGTRVPNFEIGIYRSPDCSENSRVATLNLKKAETADGLTYTWKIDNLEEGTYYVKEKGIKVEGNKVTATVNGQKLKISESDDSTEAKVVTTQSPTLNVSDYDYETSCSDVEIDIRDTNFIVASLTSNSGYFVWTENKLSAGERTVLIDYLKNNAKGKIGNITVGTTVFYSTLETIENMHYRGGVTIKDGVLTFSDTDQWMHVGWGNYSIGDGQNAEIAFTNTYTENPIKLDLQKYGTSFSGNQLDGAIFSLYKGNYNPEGISGSGIVKWDDEPLEDYNKFSVTSSNLSELVLSSGYYKLVEEIAPDGYQKLKVNILFMIEDRTVKLIDMTGAPIDSTQDMYVLEGNKESQVIKIKNDALYELPSTGGSGIFWYTVGGTLLMCLAGLLALYKNKHKRGANISVQ